MRFYFASEDLVELYETGESARFALTVINAFFRVMALIAQARDERDIRAVKGRRLERLRGNREGQYSLRLTDQYRLIFTGEQDEAGRYLSIIEIVDYH